LTVIGDIFREGDCLKDVLFSSPYSGDNGLTMQN